MERECSDEHEEGEIIDDFEEISDYSIPSTSYSGKSVSHRDLLQDVSLSSISDNEPDAVIYVDDYDVKNKRCKRKRKADHHRRKKHKFNDYYNRRKLRRYLSPSDSSDVELDPKTQKQLKDAIRIDRSNVHHNSLRTRLKAMLQHGTEAPKSEEEDVETLRTLALLSSAKDVVDECEEKGPEPKLSEDDNVDDRDEELIELRLAALKSAMLKRAPEIRRRKCKQQPNQNKDKNDINKENNVNQENNICGSCDNLKNIESSENINNIKNEEQEIVKNDNTKNTSMEEDIDIMRAKLLASMSKKITSNLPNENIFNNSTEITSQAKPVAKPSIFVKQPTKVKPLIINLNDSDSDTDVTVVKKEDVDKDKEIKLVNSVSEFLRKQRAEVEAKKKTKLPINKVPNTLDKSVVKLLPKSQQKEYHFLTQKLLMAKRKRFRRASLKLDNNKVVFAKKNSKEFISKEDCVEKQRVESKPTGLQKALEDIQIKKNGRLQMKGKYKALAPLLQKVNQASIERKHCELTIKTLLDSLQKARDKLAVSHQNYRNLVMRLTTQKNTIDRRGNKVLNTKVMNNNINIIKSTSTPVRANHAQESICDISSIHNSQDVKEQEIIPNNTHSEATDTAVTQIVSEQDHLPRCDNENNALKQYISPLDCKNRDTVDDPLITFCPFELFGVCKDPECRFNHCAKT